MLKINKKIIRNKKNSKKNYIENYLCIFEI